MRESIDNNRERSVYDPVVAGGPATSILKGSERVPLPNTLSSELQKYKANLCQWLSSARSIRVLKQRVTVELHKCGIDNWGYVRLDVPMDESIENKIGSGSGEFSRLYVREAFHECDLMLQHVHKSTKPIFQSTIDRFLDSVEFDTEELSRNRELSKMTKSAGYLDYVFLPLVSKISNGRVMLALSTQNLPSAALKQRACCNMGKLTALTEAVDAIGTSLFPEYFLGCKKSRSKLLQSQPMKLLSVMVKHDITQNQAAAMLNISVSTAEKHMIKVRQLLGVKTTYAAISRAREKGLM